MNARKVTMSFADENMAARAAWVCGKAESAGLDRRAFSINTLPDDWRLAAHALLYSAVGHYLSATGSKKPKTVLWKGRRWYLSNTGRGCLMVSAYPGNLGIVSMPGALV